MTFSKQIQTPSHLETSLVSWTKSTYFRAMLRKCDRMVGFCIWDFHRLPGEIIYRCQCIFLNMYTEIYAFIYEKIIVNFFLNLPGTGLVLSEDPGFSPKMFLKLVGNLVFSCVFLWFNVLFSPYGPRCNTLTTLTDLFFQYLFRNILNAWNFSLKNVV